MKKVTIILMLSMIFVSCVVKVKPAHPVPPGQAKKAAGTKSAKPFAPGQQKKIK
ncbi:MAG: hypothetical protein KatS3mg034_0919 [Vicingaceae bacterium]|nr:MAG: hypothetical protein KatS3mg034_0919 [Vicingaceae bacterium]